MKLCVGDMPLGGFAVALWGAVGVGNVLQS